ncbi:uracil-DNA glycosylase [Halogeometricum borinquense]|uniref:Uracil-DNA glycosylase n=1 Tax=Halogeometricum borinquense TaxID=60847 RepID=A0A6C0UCW6_9EURY|nr:uracil-DNA glycosylase family protein [Halogeometricum borinquense]QIB72980.1 uracil-DNA glycosylase [Halogeometricum borinquense]QIQ77652.1 uracil-DNA glycosylase [Halogeometricum borinquense]
MAPSERENRPPHRNDGDSHFPETESTFVLDADCTRCPELVACRTRISWGNGSRDASVMVVGEAPGAGDSDAEQWQGGNHTGMAYTTRHSGRRIRKLIAAAGHADAYYTNAVKCFPCDGDGSNREPTATERANCRMHLETELDAIEPEVVVSTGKHATATMLAFDGRELDGFLDTVLDPVELDAFDVMLLPLLHPSYQDVWLSRLGYTESEYREAIRERLP